MTIVIIMLITTIIIHNITVTTSTSIMNKIILARFNWINFSKNADDVDKKQFDLSLLYLVDYLIFIY